MSDFYFEILNKLKFIDSSVYAGLILISTAIFAVGALYYLRPKEMKNNCDNKNCGDLENTLKEL